jgi:hypothetical protein
MKTPAIERTSAAKAGWVIVLLFFGWLAFVFVPWPQGKIEEKVIPTLVDPRADFAAKLRQAGLPDNPDWDGLPEQFAIWADKAHWTANRTRFAYWNPGSQDYTYFFEARRAQGKVHFKRIPKPADYDEEFGSNAPAPEEYPLRLIDLVPHVVYVKRPSTVTEENRSVSIAPPRVEVDLPVAPVKIDQPEIHLKDSAKTEPGK